MLRYKSLQKVLKIGESSTSCSKVSSTATITSPTITTSIHRFSTIFPIQINNYYNSNNNNKNNNNNINNNNNNRLYSSLYFHNRYHFSSTKKDYYQLLGISRDASEQDIKKAFYKMAKQWHPDANKAPDAKDKFAEINEAYQILSDKNKRAQYDQFGHDGPGRFNPSDFDFSQVGLGDLFSRIFDFGMNMRAGPERGDDLQVEVKLTFMEAVNGTSKELSLSRYDECPTCKSTGMEPGSKEQRCKSCKGSGMSVHRQGGFIMQQTCPDCRGSGQLIDPCRKCNGNGIISGTHKIKVDIPAGVDDGTHVSLLNQGHAAPHKGGRGTLYVLCRVAQHPKFERHGSDIHVAVEVPIHVAVLGGQIKVPTLTGEAEVRVKPGTPSDHKEMMRFKGIKDPHTTKLGHQYLHFNVIIPKELTDKQKELIKEFGKIEDAKPKKT